MAKKVGLFVKRELSYQVWNEPTEPLQIGCYDEKACIERASLQVADVADIANDKENRRTDRKLLRQARLVIRSSGWVERAEAEEVAIASVSNDEDHARLRKETVDMGHESYLQGSATPSSPFSSLSTRYRWATNSSQLQPWKLQISRPHLPRCSTYQKCTCLYSLFRIKTCSKQLCRISKILWTPR